MLELLAMERNYPAVQRSAAPRRSRAPSSSLAATGIWTSDLPRRPVFETKALKQRRDKVLDVHRIIATVPLSIAV